jgi:hypothetical protein
MTTPLTILCACPGCDQPRRDNSKYCCEKHQQKVSRIKEREYRNAYQTERRMKYHHAYPPKRPVIVIDPCVADPYEITMSEFEQYRSKYLPGTHVIIDGAELVL